MNNTVLSDLELSLISNHLKVPSKTVPGSEAQQLGELKSKVDRHISGEIATEPQISKTEAPLVIRLCEHVKSSPQTTDIEKAIASALATRADGVISEAASVFPAYEIPMAAPVEPEPAVADDSINDVAPVEPEPRSFEQPPANQDAVIKADSETLTDQS